MPNQLIKVLMDREEMTEDEAREYVKEVFDGSDSEEWEDILNDELELEPDYLLDLMDILN